MARMVAHWIALGALVGVAAGVASALFLSLLDLATEVREAHRVIVYALPLAGLVIGVLDERFGRPIRGGTSLILDTVQNGGPQLPVRMAPMVLVGTILTHLFGGSAGREGTAVQMGASLADLIAHRFTVTPRVRMQLLAAGMAGGFGSVFGTPMAGAMFGMEVICIGRREYSAIVPAVISAFVGDLVTRLLGPAHVSYPVVARLELTVLVLGKWLLLAAAVALVTVAFIELTSLIKRALEARVRWLAVRMFIGGGTIVALWVALGTDAYLGLGIPTILRAFTDPALPWDSFAWKLVFTAVTIGAGFLGGEVTPLFFVGAALGNLMGRWLGLPIELAAGVGMAAVFGAAANTPIALSLMAVELLGFYSLPHVAIVCVAAYLMTGMSSIYPGQRFARSKLIGRRFDPPRRVIRSAEPDGSGPPRGHETG